MKILPIAIRYNKNAYRINLSYNVKINDNIAYKNLKPAVSFKGESDKNIVLANMNMEQLKTFDNIINEFKQLPQVQAIAIGGSNQSKTADKSSDIDIEIYTTEDVPLEERKRIIQKFSSKYDIGQDYFGPDDEFYVDNLKQDIDIAYFDTKWMDGIFENVWQKHNASNGYTTCFLYTIQHCKPLYDKNHWISDKKAQLASSYPDELKENIIKRNMMLLKDKPFASYYEQIKKAIERNDINSVNHRLSAFMESYFDIIFAINKKLHPGEKRLISYAKSNCETLPKDFEENINKVLTYPNSQKLAILDEMVVNLKECL